MVFFNRLAKKSVSPPVKIIIKFECFFLKSSIKPSISYTNPFTTPECMAALVEFPIKFFALEIANCNTPDGQSDAQGSRYEMPATCDCSTQDSILKNRISQFSRKFFKLDHGKEYRKNSKFT